MTDGTTSPVALLADVGGTNVRFALTSGNAGPQDVRVLRNDAFSGLGEAAEAYLAQVGPPEPPRLGAFAVACPVLGERVTLTNRAWSFSIEALRQQLRLERLQVVNDFTAVALAVPRLGPTDLLPIGAGRPLAGWPIAVIGPGTGLGVSGLIASEERWTALATEGGHATMPAANEREAEILRLVRARFGHASAERLISGPGLVNLYTALAEMIGMEPEPLTAADIAARAAAQRCPISSAAVETFCDMLGTMAGNVALTLGAKGGVYIAGGIAPKLGDLFLNSGFRHRFEEKGRFSAYLADIPTWLIVSEVPAFLGLAALLEDEMPGISVTRRA